MTQHQRCPDGDHFHVHRENEGPDDQYVQCACFPHPDGTWDMTILMRCMDRSHAEEMGHLFLEAVVPRLEAVRVANQN